MAELRLLNVLLVDDDPDALDLAMLAFQRMGLASKVHWVSSGNEAVSYLKGEGRFSDRGRYPYPSLLITDLKMPDGDGFTLLEQLRNAPEYRVTPTIVMSGSADADDVRRSHALGASSYFVKPSQFDAFERLVRLICELWLCGELPAVDASGRQLDTDGVGKVGARFMRHAEADEARPGRE